MSDAKTVRPGHPVTYVEVAPKITGGLAADLCPGESDLLAAEQAFFARQLSNDCPKVHSNPEHDSLFQRFEQLDRLLAEIRVDTSAYQVPSLYTVNDIITLVNLIRAQVLK